MIAPDRLAALLVEHLPEHLARQRWSGAHDRPIESVQLDWLEVLAPAPALLVWTLADVGFVDGSRHRYQLFLGGRPAHEPPEFLQGKDRELVATVAGDDGDDVLLYDALIDPDLAVEVLHLVAPEIEVEVRRPIVLEHSNSSVVYDESTILKIFRKVEPGPNPDVEITRVLAEAGFEHVLEPLAELRREGTDLAVLRRFVPGATEGWQMARTSVRDLLAARVPPEEAGGDLAPNMERLGSTIGCLHVAMAAAWGTTPGDVAAWADQMLADLARVATVDALDVDATRARMEELRGLDDAGVAMRIHGDLHLAQVVWVDAGWLVLDFEGEPARVPEGRFTVSSPLRDVAGVLRSLHYASVTGLAEWDEGDDELCDLLEAWERRNRDALLDGYLATDGVGPLLPVQPAARAALLAAFELDKAVYELGYELAHRPDKVDIPLAGIARLVGLAP